jgi:CrcB protein
MAGKEIRMKKYIILIGIGGMLGSIARYLTATYFAKLFPSHFPYGTFAVNMIGCLAIGIVFGLSARFNWFSDDWRIFLATGFCGGYTTFSAFAVENVQLLQNAHYTTFALYSLVSFALGLLCVFIGLTLVRI